MVHAGLRRGALDRIAKAIARARRRVRICSPVITAAPVLSILAQVVSEGELDLAGCVDQPQVHGVIHQWRQNGNVAWKLPLLERVMTGDFAGKRSEPWRPGGGLHNFMHAKLTVADDRVPRELQPLALGRAERGERARAGRPQLADQLAAYVDGVRARYPRFEFQGAREEARGRPRTRPGRVLPRRDAPARRAHGSRVGPEHDAAPSRPCSRALTRSRSSSRSVRRAARRGGRARRGLRGVARRPARLPRHGLITPTRSWPAASTRGRARRGSRPGSR